MHYFFTSLTQFLSMASLSQSVSQTERKTEGNKIISLWKYLYFVSIIPMIIIITSPVTFPVICQFPPFIFIHNQTPTYFLNEGVT